VQQVASLTIKILKEGFNIIIYTYSTSFIQPSKSHTNRGYIHIFSQEKGEIVLIISKNFKRVMHLITENNLMGILQKYHHSEIPRSEKSLK
jgi:hypothetical protein